LEEHHFAHVTNPAYHYEKLKVTYSYLLVN